MRKQLVIANWKMNGSGAENARWMAEFSAEQATLLSETVVCAPAVYLPQLSAGLAIDIGAQDVSAHKQGAYTGEVSASMIYDVGARWSIVGHSERRQYWAETDAIVAQKALRCVEAQIKPVLCVGETLEERESGRTLEVVTRQLLAVLDVIDPSQLGALAYEPVWAIGTGKSATAAQAQEVHHALRVAMAGVSASAAQTCRILYGGSVKPSNAMELFSMPDIDGGLIGGASLQASDFISIANTCLAQNL